VSAAVRIRAIAAGGDGVGALPDGRAVFVPRTAPDDLVELAMIRLSKRFARARIGRLLEAAPARTAAACPHYEGDDCGGCQLQHMTSDAQREARGRIVGDALRRIGGLDLGVPSVEPSDHEWEYRAKISLAAKGRRIGYHRVGRPDQVFDLVSCHIARPEIGRLWAALRVHRELLPPNLERIVLRVDREGGRHAIMHVAGTTVWTDASELGRALDQAGAHAVLWWQPEGGVARALYGAGGAYPAMVFEQVHPEMGDRVRSYAIAAVGDVSGKHLWDLYAGIGETTRALVARGATVESVEVDRRAVAVSERLGPAAGVIRHAAMVGEVLDRLAPADAVIVNPPRTGLGQAVAERLSARPSHRLVYISCDPATLARDLAWLGSAYRVTAVKAFDLFPQTAHVETVVEASGV
jgi:23S rRNA (uracil1939-C5)-methyltransferase